MIGGRGDAGKVGPGIQSTDAFIEGGPAPLKGANDVEPSFKANDRAPRPSDVLWPRDTALIDLEVKTQQTKRFRVYFANM